MRILPFALLIGFFLLAGCSDDDEASPTQIVPADNTAFSSTDRPSNRPTQSVTQTQPPSPTPAPTLPAPAEPAASDLVEGNLAASLPAGEAGQVSVIAIGPLQRSGSVPVVARNNTPDSIIRVHLTGIARGPDGSLLASGEDQGMNPTVVQPGEIVFGYIYFSYGAEFPAGTQYEISASWDKGEKDGSFLGLNIAEINQVEDRIVGILSNPHSVEVTGPIGVDAICFDGSGQPTRTVGTYANQDLIAPGGTAPFQLDLYGDPCQYYLLAASGFSF